MTHPVNILGLDLSYTSTGLCFPDGKTTRIVTPPVRKGPKGDPNPRYEHEKCERIDLICQQVKVVCHAYNVALVVLEGFSFGSKYGREEAGGLGYSVRRTLTRADVEWVTVPPRKLKRYATGKGNADKQAMLAATIRRFGDLCPTNNDEVDAFLLWHMGMDAAGRPVEVLPAAHRQALDGPAWPHTEKGDPPS